MGVTWHSEAEIVSLKPDTVKEIIEKIVEGENVPRVYDLEIKGNSIFFHSFNYGHYSADFGNGETLLFEKLFEQYNGALIAFEYVVYCVDHSYTFNSVWVKPEGNVDWEDEETFHKCLCSVEQEGELTHDDSFNTEEDIFDYSWRWHISLASLEAGKKKLPALFALVQAAKADGFDGWIKLKNDSDDYITYEVVCDIIDEYWDESGDDELAPFDDIEWDMIQWVKGTEIGMDDLQFELPENFPKLQTQPSNIREGKFFQPRNLTLRLRTRDSLIELLEAGKSVAWVVAKEKESQIARVQIFNWDGSLMLEASFDPSTSERNEAGRLIVGLSTKDARIIRYEPPLKWVGQNPVNYVDEKEVKNEVTLSKALKVEPGIFDNRENKLEATTAQLTQESQPCISDDTDEIGLQIAQLCEGIYREPVRLICWYTEKEGEQIKVLFRERRRGWYIEMLIDQDASEHRVLPSFLPLLEPNETIWAQITEKAIEEDWLALDEIFTIALAFPDSEFIIAGADLIGEEVASEALERFGFYVPDEELLPALIFENRRLGMILLSYLKHYDGFAGENLVRDRNANKCTVFKSLKQAQQSLKQKLLYYAEES